MQRFLFRGLLLIFLLECNLDSTVVALMPYPYLNQHATSTKGTAATAIVTTTTNCGSRIPFYCKIVSSCCFGPTATQRHSTNGNADDEHDANKHENNVLLPEQDQQQNNLQAVNIRQVLSRKFNKPAFFPTQQNRKTANNIASRRASAVAQTVARTARSGFSNLSDRAAAGLVVAGIATENLQGILQQGQSNTVSIIQWIDGYAKEGVSNTNSLAKIAVLKFTGKSKYVFGDIAREIIRRASSSSVSLQDLMLLLKIFLTVGASFTPLAKFLPLTVLLDMLNVSIESRVGGRLLQVLAESIDERFLAAFTAEELGDLAKRSLLAGITAFTGRNRYEAGDIEQAVQKEVDRLQQQEKVPDNNNVGNLPAVMNFQIIQQQQQQQEQQKSVMTLDLCLGPEFEAWDSAFRESHPGDWAQAVETAIHFNQLDVKELDKELVSELEEWDERFARLIAGNKANDNG